MSMNQKFHINKHGVPAPCKAKNGNCPLGGAESHFNSRQEAQNSADRENERKFGLLPDGEKSGAINYEEFFTVAKDDVEKEYIEGRKKRIRGEKYVQGEKYINRCNTVERLDNYIPNKNKTSHFYGDREDRVKGLEDAFGKGNVVGHYKVNHKVGTKDRDQIVEVRDTGQLVIYDIKTGRAVTTFISHRQRIEIMMLNAGEIARENWLKKVSINRKEASRRNLN